MAIGRDLYLKNPQNQIGLTGGADPRIAEIHVVHQCSSKATPALHTCGPATADWDADAIFATIHDNVIPAGFLAYTPRLTCCAPYGGTIAPAGVDTPSNMGYWYANADLGPLAPCTTSSGIAARLRHCEWNAGPLDQLERDSDDRDQPHSGCVLFLQVDGRQHDPGGALLEPEHAAVDGAGDDLHRREHLHQPEQRNGEVHGSGDDHRLGNVRDEERDDLCHPHRLHRRVRLHRDDAVGPKPSSAGDRL